MSKQGGYTEEFLNDFFKVMNDEEDRCIFILSKDEFHVCYDDYGFVINFDSSRFSLCKVLGHMLKRDVTAGGVNFAILELLIKLQSQTRDVLMEFHNNEDPMETLMRLDSSDGVQIKVWHGNAEELAAAKRLFPFTPTVVN